MSWHQLPRWPKIAQMVDIAVALAIAEDAIAGRVRTDIKIGGQVRQNDGAWFGDSENRARFWIALAKPQEIIGMLGRHDGQVDLDISGRQSRSLGSVFAGATVGDEASISLQMRSITSAPTRPYVRGLGGIRPTSTGSYRMLGPSGP